MPADERQIKSSLGTAYKEGKAEPLIQQSQSSLNNPQIMVGNPRANPELTRLYSRSVTGQKKRAEIQSQTSDYVSKYDTKTANRRRRSQKTSDSRDKSKQRHKTKSNKRISSTFE